MTSLPTPAAPAVVASRARKGTEFVYFVFENAYGYKGRHLVNLRNVGLCNVIGRNHESKSTSSSGAGKSRMWRLFLYLFYGKVALEGSETVKDMMVFPDDFRLEVGYITRDGKAYILRESRKHSKFGDGLVLLQCPEGFRSQKRVPVGAENAPQLLRALAQSQINLTYKEATGTVIWPQGFGHALIRGKPSERAQWLSDLTGLTQYDDMHQELSERMRQVRAEISTLLEFRGEYRVVEEDLQALTAEGDIEAVKVKGRQLQADVRKRTDEIKAVRDRKQNASLRLATLRRIDSYVSAARLLKLELSERDLAQRGELLQTFEVSAASANTRAAQLRQNISDVTRLKQLQLELGSDLTEVVDTEDARREHTELVGSVIPRLERIAEQTTETVDAVAAAAADLENELQTYVQNLRLGADSGAVDDFIRATQARIAEIDGSVSANTASSRRLEAALRLQAGCECPTCLQVVTNSEVIRNAVAGLNLATQQLCTERTALADELASAQDMLAVIDALADIPARTAKAQARARALVDLSESRARAADLNATLTVASQKTRKVAERDSLLSRVGGLEEAALRSELETVLADLVGVDTRRQKYTEAQSTYDSAYAAASEVGVDDPFSFDVSTEIGNSLKLIDRYDAWLAQAEAAQTSDNGRIVKLLGIVRTHAERSQHLTELQEKVDRLLVLEDEEIILAANIKAYSKTGMKMDLLKNVIDRISVQLPKWVRYLFTEPYFAVKAYGTATKLSLQVRKKFVVDNKEIIKWVDASALSGGEESRFAVCIMLTLAELVAPEKRTNLLVLDETDRSCDAYGQQLIASLLIPMMRRKKESIFVITHQLQIDPQVVDSELYVTKHKSGLTETNMVSTSKRR